MKRHATESVETVEFGDKVVKAQIGGKEMDGNRKSQMKRLRKGRENVISHREGRAAKP